MRISGLVHCVEDPAVHWLQTIPEIRDRSADNDRHRIVQIGRPHLLLDRDAGSIVNRTLWRCLFFVFRSFRRVAQLSCPIFQQGLYLVAPLYQNQHIRCNA